MLTTIRSAKLVSRSIGGMELARALLADAFVPFDPPPSGTPDGPEPPTLWNAGASRFRTETAGDRVEREGTGTSARVEPRPGSGRSC
jgi:hypothetical protein